MKASRSADQLLVSLVIAAADSPACDPKNSASAGTKSLEESPCRYRSGSTSATFGERRAYGGRITLRNRHRFPVLSSTQRSSTRGALTPSAPAPATRLRGWAWPFRTTRAWPRSSRASWCRSQVGIHLGLERDRQHPLGPSAADLIQGEGELLADVLVREYPERRHTSSRRRLRAGSSDQ